MIIGCSEADKQFTEELKGESDGKSYLGRASEEIIPQRSLVLVKYFSVQGLGDSVLLVHAVGNAQEMLRQ
ncbi:hypothetical protein K7X08_036493 [Anisodus acutangulus]|uniref:Uncharacterized protein n=1 Tax=Anisodus acutangulus TaxID=402998 RepID=A0A9Q1L5D6_9SOLA|nr:hypothetical protein K7X08_036493 [Anisodus acutangulus]